jgi:hypothetical protein
LAGPVQRQGGRSRGRIPALSIQDEALAVALEHVHWCRCRGLSPADICAALGTSYVPRPGNAGWTDLVWLVAGAWLGLRNIKTPRTLGLPRTRTETGQPTLPGIAPPGGAKGGEIDMSRIRSVHPSQWTEEDFVACSFPARLLLLGLRNEADDHGVFEWRPHSLKLRLFPADDIAIEPLFDELVAHGHVAAYQIDGCRYGKCTSWAQQPQHPSYRYPLPPPEPVVAKAGAKAGATAQGALTEPSATPHPVTVMVEESKKGASRGRARPAPPPQDLPDEWREEAQRQRAEQGLPAADLDEQWRRFRNLNAEETDMPARWRGRWLNWALDAKPAPGDRAEAAAGGEAPRSAEERAGDERRRAAREAVERETAQQEAARLEQIRIERAELRAFWAGVDGAYDRFDMKWLLWLERWGKSGEWPPIAGPAPAKSGCLAPDELIAHAIAKRTTAAPPASIETASAAAGLEQQQLAKFWAGLSGAERHPVEWRLRLAGWAATGWWLKSGIWGPPPDRPDCEAPPELLDYARRHRAAMLGAATAPAAANPAAIPQQPAGRAKRKQVASGQREMLMPLAGGAGAGIAATEPPAAEPAPDPNLPPQAGEGIRAAGGARRATTR